MIGHDQPFCIIGERINPTGRRIFQEQLRAGDLSAIERDVEAQVDGGANVLDVNMGVPLTDEADLLARAITLVQELTDLPICIDSSVVEALEAGLSAYQGRALVNSVTAEDDRMEAILPLVKRYGAAVIALPNDDDEIPMEADKRLELTKKIIDTATGSTASRSRTSSSTRWRCRSAPTPSSSTGYPRDDPPDPEEFGVNMTLGASNVSFGMPGRPALGAAFLPMAMPAGLTSAIMDARTPQIVEAVKAADLLLGHDEWGAALDRGVPGAAGEIAGWWVGFGPSRRRAGRVGLDGAGERREGLVASAGVRRRQPGAA